MPYCTSCGISFEGRGNHCLVHSLYHYSTKAQDQYDLSSDLTDSAGTKYRTAHFHQQQYKPRRPRGYENHHYEYADHDQSHGALTRYKASDELAPLPSPRTMATADNTLRAAATTFQALNNHHAIDSMSFSVSADGTRSISAHANKDREQCPVCRKWFPDRRRLDVHKREFSSGCEFHAVCFGDDEAYFHGCSERHDRCFLRGCGSVYRREGGWKSAVVEAHVKGWHQ